MARPVHGPGPTWALVPRSAPWTAPGVGAVSKPRRGEPVYEGASSLSHQGRCEASRVPAQLLYVGAGGPRNLKSMAVEPCFDVPCTEFRVTLETDYVVAPFEYLVRH